MRLKIKQQYLIISLIVLLGYGFSQLPVFTPGINQPTAIDPYLDGVFPTMSPTGGNDHWVVENAYPNLTFTDPVAMLELPGQNGYYVVGKPGFIWQISNDPGALTKDLVLDISTLVDTDGDAGLLNAVLHPEFGQAGSSKRGYIYVFYRWHPGGGGGCVEPAFLRLSRFNLPDGETAFDPASEFILVQTYDEHCWHNGGGMFFDEDGYFYYTVGDAGGINDPYGTTQIINERLMSGLFRIDLDMDPARSHPIRRQQVDPASNPYAFSSFSQGYFIPNDNPWQDVNGSVLEEFYALGLRSPHRATLDTMTGNIWIGDVGQGSREEISVVTGPGQNLQWPFREGNLNGNSSEPDPLIGTSTPPIYDYTHAVGNSIIGGMMYRGDFYQGALNGRYLFGDHGVRNIWTYNPDNGEVIFLVNVPDFGSGDKKGISHFAANSAGEVFVLKLYGTDQDGGVIYRLKQDSQVPEPPMLLSQTGAFSDLLSLTPAPGIIPYKVNAPLWSDGAEKQRWIALPNDGVHDSPEEQITFSANGNWQFPAGTVFIKHFELPIDENNPTLTKRLETRFFVITENGGGYGVTYQWNETNTDATLLVNSVSEDIDITLANGSSAVQTWKFPSRTDCMTCHNANADFVLGVHTWQLNGDLTYPSGITDNQLSTWQHLGMFTNPFDTSEISGFLQSANIGDESVDLGTRVRSYLDANCAHCHRPNGVEGAFDARFSTLLENQQILWTFGASRNTPDDHYIVKPLDTSESEIWIRDGSLGQQAMPPLAKKLVDEEYMAVLTEWINSLEDESCIEIPLTDLNWKAAQNYVGPVEIDSSNGESQPNDGSTITINGQTFERGLGVHAYSAVTYRTNGDYERFQSHIGVDDEVEPCNASVQFEVYTDGVMIYQSPVLRSTDDALEVDLNIIGAQEVQLVMTDSGDGEACDHGDWANPRFLTCLGCEEDGPCDDGDPCTINDVYDDLCNCAGVYADSDGDGFCDADDLCPGFDDLADADGDGVPDGCDLCPGFDDHMDIDQDNIPDACDECVGRYTQVCPSSDCDVIGNPIIGGTYAAELQLNSNAWVDHDSTVIFQAGNLIRLKPGFKAVAGAEFQASIIECEISEALLAEAQQNNSTSLVSNVPPVESIQTDPGQPKPLYVRAHPNPFTDVLNLYIAAPHPAMKRATLRIMDISGRVIYQKFDVAFDQQWSISAHRGWGPGLYYVHIQCSEYQHVQTIVKH